MITVRQTLFILFLWQIGIGARMFAQIPGRTTITGTVTNLAGKPIEFATMMLLPAADSTAEQIIKGAVSDSAGQYVFENVAVGSYRVAITAVGYQKTVSAPFVVGTDQALVNGPTLAAKEDSRTLSEVKVTAKKPFIEQLPDKTIVNVENSIVATGGTALDVLEKSPGVMVDTQNDRISLKGRDGVLVMIDGKPTYLSTQQVMTLLRNTPSGSIQSIELITNPSAKYDAAGNSGIINIKLRRGSSTNGTNGSVTISGGYGRMPKLNDGLTLNHRRGKWNLFGSYNYDFNETFFYAETRNRFRQDNTTTTIQSQNNRPEQNRSHTFKAGADYFLGKNTIFGVVVNGSLGNNTGQTNNNSVVYTQLNTRESSNLFVNATRQELHRVAANANYKHTFWGADSLNRELTINLDYSTVQNRPLDNMTTRFSDGTGAETTTLLQRNTSPSDVIIRSGKLDYLHSITKTTKLEAGWKTSYVTTDNDIRFEQQISGLWAIDPGRTNHFIYDETINAAYLNGNHSWEKWSLQGGVRMEQTRSVGNSITVDKIVNRSYVNLFPSVFLTYDASKDHQWRTSYSRRIDRPSYQDLNPFLYIVDPYNFFQGNAFLRPQYTDAIQVGYTYQSQTTIGLSFNRTTETINQVLESYPETRQTKITLTNLDAKINIALSVGLPLTITKWWTIQQTVDLFWNQYRVNYLDQRVEFKRLSANLTMNHSFTLPKDFTAELSAWYNSPIFIGIMDFRGMGQVNVGVQKSLWNKKATLRLNVNDVLYITRYQGFIKYANTDQWFKGRGEPRVTRLTFSYNFGNQTLQAVRQRRTGVEEEQSRIKGAQ